MTSQVRAGSRGPQGNPESSLSDPYSPLRFLNLFCANKAPAPWCAVTQTRSPRGHSRISFPPCAPASHRPIWSHLENKTQPERLMTQQIWLGTGIRGMILNPIPGGLQSLLCLPPTTVVLYQCLVFVWITCFPGKGHTRGHRLITPLSSGNV